MDENSDEKITNVVNPGDRFQTFFVHTHMIFFLGKNLSLIEALIWIRWINVIQIFSMNTR